ncbi:hypothetical protein HCN44_007263 [Aphidius gifuensis]|uniref:dynamin GTPase n=1 Tax=Aphidius gifuensis TaxID=684658 RepID=A0A835CPA0_APHGI|nr:hypothetical protein HCN44_007263 [Aphidius gifuensis]
MKKLIPVINKIQNIVSQAGLNVELNLPQIVVIGCQSAGKSSVLENFVGKDFLPRGSGIVTRRPLVLQLITAKTEYAEFLHNAGRKYNISEVRNEIESETNRTEGKKGVSNRPINLTIYSPHVVNLTLVDLPGLIKISMDKQKPDIGKEIEKMVREYIEKKNSLILAVTPANSDLANSDALKLAQEIDPEGLRTIGVITKLDLMDKGTDARDVLENKVFKLLRGYIGVVSRSQQDIDENKDIGNALDAEKNFFLNHSSYKHMADRLGTEYLQHELNKQLTNHIHQTLPTLREQLQKQLIEIEEFIEKYDHFKVVDHPTKTKAMYQMLHQLSTDFEAEIGNYNLVEVRDAPYLGSKIYRLYHSTFPRDIATIIIDGKILDKQIEKIILDARGVKTGLFTPDVAFEAPVKKQIARLEDPSLQFISVITGIVDEIGKKIIHGELEDVQKKITNRISHYPKLRARVQQNMSVYIRQCEKICRDRLSLLIKFELTYLNTKHPDFMATTGAYQQFDHDVNEKGNVTDQRMTKQIELIRDYITSYMKIVKEKIIDLVPKAIQYTVIEATKTYLKEDLVIDLTQHVDQLMELSEDEARIRNEKAPNADQLVGHNAGMKKLIPVINKIRNIVSQAGLNVELNLPQIVVVGCQSAGKSSVLENFVGKDFLPRGSGIVTRRPLVLQLITAKTEYAEFLHNAGRKYNISEVRNEIESETNRTEGKKGVSNRPINLTIYSPHVVNLTLVDLPGLIKISIDKQKPDIGKEIEKMVREFIEKKNSLILAVTPADSDLANSDALKLAQEIDPEGLRTIGVITKLDLMDKGTDARDVLENKVFKLRRGYIGVVSRSQQDIDENKDIGNALEAEKQFFLNHPSYKHMADRLGTEYLQHELNKQLTNHIHATMSALREQLRKQLMETEDYIEKYDHFKVVDYLTKTKAMQQMLHQLSTDFEAEIANLSSKIYHLYHVIFPQDIGKIIIDGKILDKQIEKIIFDARGMYHLNIYHQVILNTTGVKTGLFTPDVAFEAPVKKQIARLEEPSLQFISVITGIVDEIGKKIIHGELEDVQKKITNRISYYPKLHERVKQNITSYIRKCEKICRDHLSFLIKFELTYLNTNHPDFMATTRRRNHISQSTAYQPVSHDNDENGTVTEQRMSKQVKVIRSYIDNYMKIVKERMIDLVPKAIQYTVIEATKIYIKEDLIIDLSAHVEQLMELSDDEVRIRNDKYQMRETYKEALRIIDDLSNTMHY